jgi:hypothetical protein
MAPPAVFLMAGMSGKLRHQIGSAAMRITATAAQIRIAVTIEAGDLLAILPP